ncbi:MAG: diguanylate cyclase, partial [Clostridiales bacterium]|nr:diguanylate cyclase [Clostridiales bacterium]
MDHIYGNDFLLYAVECVEDCPDSIMWVNDKQKIIYCNKAACEEVGYSREELLLMPISMVDPEYEEEKMGMKGEMWKPFLDGKSVCFNSIHKHKDGHLIPVEIHSRLIYKGNESVSVCFSRDISKQVQERDELYQLYEEVTASEEELKIQNEQILLQQKLLEEKHRMLEMVIEASCDGMWLADLKTGRHMYTNNWFEQMGTSNDENFEIRSYEDRMHPDDREAVHLQMKCLLEGKVNEIDQNYRVLDKNGVYRWVRSKAKVFFDDTGKPEKIAGVNTDIDKLKKQDELLEYLAYHDSLTDLPNRALFLDRLGNAIKLARRSEHRVAVLFIDIDNFKVINDSLGHSFGDEILRQAGKRIGCVIRESDTVARLGGDEFSVLLQDISSINEVADLASRLKEAFQESFKVKMTTVHLSSSIGIAVFPDDGVDAQELMKHADTAMYKAKDSGRDMFCFFNKSMKEETFLRMELEIGLRNAVENNEFSLHFQPQYNLCNGGLRGFEALLRWNSPTLGNIGPVQFIPVAEKTTLINPIGKWVLNEACRTAVSWKENSGFDGIISVNISAIQLRNDEFLDTVKNAIEASGIKPEKLELEITESVFIDFYEAAVA